MVQLVCHPQTIDKLYALGSRSKVGEYFGLIHGNPGSPPEDGFYDVATEGLKDPAHIFRGINRPMHYGHATADKDVFVYVVNSEFTYTVLRSKYGDVVMPAQAPKDSVFTTFVSFDDRHVDEVKTSMGMRLESSPNGVVLYWEWTECSPDDPTLPCDSGSRYDKGIYNDQSR